MTEIVPTRSPNPARMTAMASMRSLTLPPDDAGTPVRRGHPNLSVRVALTCAGVIVFGLAVLAGWLGWGTWRSHQAQQQRELFLQVGRQAALNLTTISYTEADADVQRVLDMATGHFQTISRRGRPNSSTPSNKRSRNRKAPSPRQAWNQSRQTRPRYWSPCR
jgi:Mce-associated membrane protein